MPEQLPLDEFIKKYKRFKRSDEMLTFLHEQISSGEMDATRAYHLISVGRSPKGNTHCSGMVEGEIKKGGKCNKPSLF